MTVNGDPYENATAERINGILKNEFGLHNLFKTHYEATIANAWLIDHISPVRLLFTYIPK